MALAYLITGKRGEGKGLSSVQLIKKYLDKGSVVATNMNLNLEYLLPAYSQTLAYRLPDIPTHEDLHNLPNGTSNLFNESTYGLLLLDEVSVFLNAQKWNEKGRQEMRSFFAHSRKMGWDLAFCCQWQNQFDSQLRESLIDIYGEVKRLDKINIPFVTWFFSHFFDIEVRFPKYSLCILTYGNKRGAPTFGKLISHPKHQGKAYDTTQIIGDIDHKIDAIYTYLPPMLTKGRYMKKNVLYRPFFIKGFLASSILFLIILAITLFFKNGHIKELDSKIVDLNNQLKTAPTVLTQATDLKENIKDKPIQLPIVKGLLNDGNNMLAIVNNDLIPVAGVRFEKGLKQVKINADWITLND